MRFWANLFCRRVVVAGTRSSNGKLSFFRSAGEKEAPWYASAPGFKSRSTGPGKSWKEIFANNKEMLLNTFLSTILLTLAMKLMRLEGELLEANEKLVAIEAQSKLDAENRKEESKKILMDSVTGISKRLKLNERQINDLREELQAVYDKEQLISSLKAIATEAATKTPDATPKMI